MSGSQVCILSDSHDNLRALTEAAFLIKQIRPQLVVHCGDITSPAALEELRDLPLRFVFGNCDGNKQGLNAAAARFGLEPGAEHSDLSFAGRSIFVYHGTDAGLLEKTAASGRYDYIFTGHTHRQRDERFGRTRVINPGALFRARFHTFAQLDIMSDELLFLEVDKG